MVFRISGLSREARAWTAQRYRPFLVDKAPDVTIAIRAIERSARLRGRPPRLRRDDGSFELALGPCRAAGRQDGRQVRFTVPAAMAPLNPTVFRALCSFLLFREGGFLLHAAAVVERGRAWVFCGRSGSGKTTVARLAGDRLVLNDDTTGVRRVRGGFRACATPFFGEGGPGMGTRNVCAPIAAVCFLVKSDRFAHRRLGASEAIARALPDVFLPKGDPATAGALLDALAALVGRVPCYELSFARDPALWDYVRDLA